MTAPFVDSLHYENHRISRREATEGTVRTSESFYDWVHRLAEGGADAHDAWLAGARQRELEARSAAGVEDAREIAKLRAELTRTREVLEEQVEIGGIDEGTFLVHMNQLRDVYNQKGLGVG